MNKVVIWYSIQNGGDGSAYPRWFASQSDADLDQEQMEEEGWGEPCIGSIETFEGSDCHRDAIINSKDLHNTTK